MGWLRQVPRAVRVTTPDAFLTLFEPIDLGPKTLRNRFYQVPHCGVGDLRPGTQAAFRGIRAEGGWGAVCVESASIAPETDQGQVHLARIWDEYDVRNLAVVADSIHEHDALAGIELWWGGGTSCTGLETRMPGRAPSQIACTGTPWVTPQEMTLDDVAQVRELFSLAADRARRAGFDIVYVYGGHSQGPMQFLSTTFNHRSDAYGGSFEGRARFWLECLDTVRDTVGSDVAVTTRISVQDFGWGGVSNDDALAFVALADSRVDFWDVNVGSLDWSTDIASSRFFPQNSQRPWTSAIRAATRKPIVCVGRFTDPGVMVEALRSGQCDIIGAARPAIADPFLPAKIRDGLVDEIRECIGCNYCLSRWAQGGAPVACTQNPTAGEEYRRGWHPERHSRARNADKSVLIVGAGPAGLECARILGLRQMSDVHLVDAAQAPGGSLSWLSTLPRLGEWRHVIDYRVAQLRKLTNVTAITGRRLTADEVRGYGADIVIVATGAHWVGNGLGPATYGPIPGASSDLPHVVTPEQLLLDHKPVGDRVLVYDCEGVVTGIGICELLASQGKEVTLLTPAETPAEYARFTGEVPQVRRALAAAGVKVRTETIVTSVNSSSVGARGLYDDEEADIACDTIVLLTQRRSNDALYLELTSAGTALEPGEATAVYRIGDCAAPRMTADCVFDGHRLAREIDSPDPARPLPFIRELRLLGNPADTDYSSQLDARQGQPPVEVAT
jgi:dimethylamine/trimethylamine dehydrogenase